MKIGRYDTAITPSLLAQQVKGAAFKNAVSKIPPQLLNKTEGSLGKLIRLTEMDYQIKESFWNEYVLARKSDRKMDTKNIYQHICTYTHFYNNLLKNSYKLAWIISPILGIPKSLDSFQSLILLRVEEILKAENCYTNGEWNFRLLEAKIKLFEVLSNYKS